ncbi:AAA family ATPase [Candidatus Aerophobetes bacterium]|nr:AAA family ATPase [Candidatus Aerophobetes bacterium]
MNYLELIDNIRKLPQPKIYKNSTEVCRIKATPLNMWDVVTAALIARLNILLVGERGEGKTQLATEINDTYFGGKGTLIRAHPDLKIKDIYTALNLEKLASAKGDTHQALEIVASTKNPLTILDEINRVPQITQNQTLSILDGYINLPERNEQVFFGVDGFHVSIATANVGKSYSGTFPFDPAYLDRSHLIINIDNFPPTTTDLIKIQQQDINPGLKRVEGEDCTNLIIQIWKHISNINLSLDGLIFDLYLKKSLDFCAKSPTKRKNTVRDDIPNMCQGCMSGEEKTGLSEVCGYVIPTSTRSFKAYKTLAIALYIVADAKSDTPSPALPGYQETLQAFRVTAPYSGMLDAAWVKREYHGNPYLAIDFVCRKIKSNLEEKADYIKKAFYDALRGRLARDTIETLGEEWLWIEEILNEMNLIARNSSPDLIEEIKEGRTVYTQDFWMGGILHPDQTLFGERITHLTWQEDVGRRIRETLDSMYGIAFASEDGIYVWYEGMTRPKQIFKLSPEKFKKKKIKGLAFVRGKLLFAAGNEIYDVDNPEVPVLTTSSPIEVLTQSGESLLGTEAEKIWISREGKGKEVMIPWENKISCVVSAPVYKLKKF